MKRITKIEQVQELPLYTDVFTFFYCTRCSKKFWARAIIERDHGMMTNEPRLADERIVWMHGENQDILYCSRCSRAFWSFESMK